MKNNITAKRQIPLSFKDELRQFFQPQIKSGAMDDRAIQLFINLLDKVDYINIDAKMLERNLKNYITKRHSPKPDKLLALQEIVSRHIKNRELSNGVLELSNGTPIPKEIDLPNLMTASRNKSRSSKNTTPLRFDPQKLYEDNDEQQDIKDIALLKAISEQYGDVAISRAEKLYNFNNHHNELLQSFQDVYTAAIDNNNDSKIICQAIIELLKTLEKLDSSKEYKDKDLMQLNAISNFYINYNNSIENMPGALEKFLSSLQAVYIKSHIFQNAPDKAPQISALQLMLDTLQNNPEEWRQYFANSSEDSDKQQGIKNKASFDEMLEQSNDTSISEAEEISGDEYDEPRECDNPKRMRYFKAPSENSDEQNNLHNNYNELLQAFQEVRTAAIDNNDDSKRIFQAITELLKTLEKLDSGKEYQSKELIQLNAINNFYIKYSDYTKMSGALAKFVSSLQELYTNSPIFRNAPDKELQISALQSMLTALQDKDNKPDNAKGNILQYIFQYCIEVIQRVYAQVIKLFITSPIEAPINIEDEDTRALITRDKQEDLYTPSINAYLGSPDNDASLMKRDMSTFSLQQQDATAVDSSTICSSSTDSTSVDSSSTHNSELNNKKKGAMLPQIQMKTASVKQKNPIHPRSTFCTIPTPPPLQTSKVMRSESSSSVKERS